MDTVSLTIEKPAAGGRMIARLDGQVVLVSGAIPGERVTARIERAGKGVLYAATVGVDEASPDRRPVPGDPECGGCLYAHVAYDRQLGLKSDVIADAFARIGKLTLPRRVAVAASPENGYRMRARLHIRGHRLGFFREGTHDICDARATGQLLPVTCDVLDRLVAGINSLGLDVRELDLSENVDASDRAVSLDAAAAMDAGTLDRLGATQGVTAFGPDAVVTERMTVLGADVSLRRSVLAFFQGNRYLLHRLAEHVVGGVARGATLVDLYAGAGLFAVCAAAAKHATVRAVEGDRVSAADLIANVAAWDTVDALRQPVEAFLSASPKRADVVIVDPPRTGMSREALDGVIRLRAPKIMYVSCDVATLARDARRLVESGYVIDRADAFDLFPNTPHVETVVVFVLAS
jgi:23S rRNA (uracil1939-C5)-methyltransferase